ncbi:unnamed protein product [Sphenostylis stenocarpa]|uniref:Uncharacterized protein n=1 Tax=Sphenostylis stenocarpa TaxID=92480 RepID=A0AA86SM49_9FABA|nr:unnamed protein product [Sphenostylis stenocarpa]
MFLSQLFCGDLAHQYSCGWWRLRGPTMGYGWSWLTVVGEKWLADSSGDNGDGSRDYVSLNLGMGEGEGDGSQDCVSLNLGMGEGEGFCYWKKMMNEVETTEIKVPTGL